MMSDAMQRIDWPRSWRAAVVVWLLCALVSSTGAGLTAQVEESVEPATYGESTEKMEAEFEAAMAVFQSVRQAESIPLLSQLIDEILGDRPPPPGPRRDLLTRALFRRAEAQLNLGENDAAEADLAQVAEVDPGFDASARMVSPKLADLFEEARARVAGYIDAQLDPADSQVRLDGSRIELRRAGVTPVLAGTYRVSIERPGYAGVERDIEVTPGSTVPLEATLERDSATVRVRTMVDGVEVAIEGVSQGVTRVVETPPPQSQEVPDEAEAGPATEAEVLEPGGGPPIAELVVDGLTVGEHVLELSKEGYRSGGIAVTVEDLTDYELEVIALEETRGTLQVLGMPADASLLVDGETLFPAGSAEGDLSLPLPVGEHLLEIEAGTLGGLAEYFTLEDRGEVTVQVRLKARLVLLAILGGDADAARRLSDGLAARFDGHEHWLYADGSDGMRPRFEELGLDADDLRSGGGGDIDWQRVQASAGEQAPGSVYLVAVLSDDLLAGGADLWTIPAAPAAAVAERASVDLGSEAALDDWASGFATPAAWTRPWLGVTLLDSGLSDGPVIALADASGPVAEAGARVGDVVVAVDGRQVSTAAEVFDAFAAAAESAELALLRAGEPSTLTVPVTRRPAVVVDLDTSSPVATTLAWAAIEEARGGGTPAWVLGLNRAAAYRRHAAWPEVILALRGIEAPQQDGIGQAAVDYWLGVALLETDPAAYREQAVEVLQRAAEAEVGRLKSADGPRVADRARARLEVLGASSASPGS